MATKHVVTTGSHAIHRQAKSKEDLKCSAYLCPGVTIQLKRITADLLIHILGTNSTCINTCKMITDLVM